MITESTVIILFVAFALHSCISLIISNKINHENGGYYFWMVFLFGILGAILWVLLDIRNMKLDS